MPKWKTGSETGNWRFRLTAYATFLCMGWDFQVKVLCALFKQDNLLAKLEEKVNIQIMRKS